MLSRLKRWIQFPVICSFCGASRPHRSDENCCRLCDFSETAPPVRMPASGRRI